MRLLETGNAADVEGWWRDRMGARVLFESDEEPESLRTAVPLLDWRDGPLPGTLTLPLGDVILLFGRCVRVPRIKQGGWSATGYPMSDFELDPATCLTRVWQWVRPSMQDEHWAPTQPIVFAKRLRTVARTLVPVATQALFDLVPCDFLAIPPLKTGARLSAGRRTSP